MRRTLFALAGILALAGCTDAGGTAGHGVATAGVAAAVGSATGNPIIGLVAGVAAAFAVDQGVKYGERSIQNNVQEAIAYVAGPLEPGQAGKWQIESDLPLSGRSGTAQVARAFGEAIPCKDVIFTVGDYPDFFVTTICRNRNGEWRWATAEPSIHRWGALQ